MSLSGTEQYENREETTMAKPKATHFGECQVCGSLQKLPGGVMSLHGYTVDWHSFNGVCWGAKGKPFEKSFDLIQEDIDRTKAYRERLLNTVKELCAPATDETTVWMDVFHPYSGRTPSYYAWENLGPLTMTTKTHDDGWVSRSFFYTKDDKQVQLSNSDYGYEYGIKSVAEVAQIMNRKYAEVLAKRAAKAQSHIDWQQKRIDTWQERELRPVHQFPK
jgi:hypothetical protein